MYALNKSFLAGACALVAAVALSLVLATQALGAVTLTDSYDISHWDYTGWATIDAHPRLGQTFTANVGGTLDSALLYLGDGVEPPTTPALVGQLYAELWAVTGTFGGSDNVPVGVPMATSAPVNAESLPDGTTAPVTFQFDNSVALTQGEHYAIVVHVVPAGDPGALLIKGDEFSADPPEPTLHPGTLVDYYTLAGWYGNPLYDLIFYVYVNPPAPPTGTLQGTVSDAITGLPIAGASVDAGAAGTTSTGADGTYTFANVPEDSYTVAASKAGYGPESAGGVVVLGGQVTIQDFALNPTPATAIDDIITAVDEAVGDGTLAGSGPGSSGTGKLGAFENMLASVEASITAGDYAGALAQLRVVYTKCDGLTPPADFVTGPARDVIAKEVLALIAKLEALVP